MPRFQAALLTTAKRSKKLRGGFSAPAVWARNTPQRLGAALAPFRSDGTLPDYPLGSDFTEVEQRVVKALGWLKANTATRSGKLRTILAALASGHRGETEALARMALDAPKGLSQWLYARLLRHALARTGSP